VIGLVTSLGAESADGIQKTRRFLMNAGYQKEDTRLLDYDLWSLGKLHLRGPRLDLQLPFFPL
jgi:hypothetical protein